MLALLAKAAFRVFALILLLATVASSASAQGAASGFDRLGAVRVDIRPILARGAGLQAEALRSDLALALRKSLADRFGSGGPTLVVVVRALSLQPYAGSVGGGRSGFGGAMENDYLDGEALLVDRKGAVIARHKQLSALPASSGGAWYDPASERRRVTAIAEHWAQWLSRELPRL